MEEFQIALPPSTPPPKAFRELGLVGVWGMVWRNDFVMAGTKNHALRRKRPQRIPQRGYTT
jgi:hypothetical protein